MKLLPSLEALHLNLIYDPFAGTLEWRISGEPFGKSYDLGYVIGYFDGEQYYAHRVIYKMMTGEEPEIVDHENGFRSDNRWSNLGNVTPLKNKQNLGVAKNNTSGITGVHVTRSGTFKASICVKRQRHWLGVFKNRDDAVAARRDAEKLYGFHPNHGRRYNL